MIGRAHRFHGHNSLNHVYRFGKAERAQSMTLRYVKAKKPDYRLAVVVSKKVSKSAVVRNRIRRRLYESVRELKKEANMQWPFDMILTIHDDRLAAAPADEVRQQMAVLLKKSHLI